MTTTHNEYPDEFDEWVVKKGLREMDGSWWIFKRGEKDWTEFAENTDELYQIYLKEKKH